MSLRFDFHYSVLRSSSNITPALSTDRAGECGVSPGLQPHGRHVGRCGQQPRGRGEDEDHGAEEVPQDTPPPPRVCHSLQVRRTS